jgi:HlyD family secretion protein
LDDLLNSRDSDFAQAEQNLANAKQAVEDAQKDVTKLDYRRASDDLLDQTQAEIDLANEQVSYAEDAYKLVKNRTQGDPLRAQALLNLTNARLNRDRKQATLDWYLGKPSEIDAAKYRAALSVALAQEAAAQREYDRLKDGPDAEKLSLLEARLNAAKAGVEAFTVTAPFDGVVAELNAKAGSSISAGEIAVTIADTSSWIVVTTDVTEIDVVNLTEGQPVTVTLDAISDANLKGKILSIGQTFSQNQGDIVYEVTILLTDKNPAMRWGMTAVVKFEQ